MSLFFKNIWQHRHESEFIKFHAFAALLACVIFVPMLSVHVGWASTSPLGAPMQLTCRNMFWLPSYDCGINGINCSPAPTDWMAIRCPSRCSWPDDTLMSVGGSNLYRGDSRVCVSATHAGLVSPTTGGCVKMRLKGPASNFVGSLANGINSITSPLWFPQSMEFEALPGASQCTEIGWIILVVLLVWLVALSLIVGVLPFFAWTMVCGFWYSTLVSQQISDLPTILSNSTANFFLMIAGGTWMFLTAGKTVLWRLQADEDDHHHDSEADEPNEDHHAASSLAGSDNDILASINNDESLSVSLSESTFSVAPIQAIDIADDEQSASSSSHQQAQPSLPCLSSNCCIRCRSFFHQRPSLANPILFLLPFTILLHQNLLTYFLPDIDLSPVLFKMAASQVSALITVIFCVVAVLCLAVYFCCIFKRRPLRVRTRVMIGYVTLFSVYIVIFVSTLRPTYSFHIHHAFLPLVLVPMIRSQRDPVALVCLGILCGMFVNGLTLWGWAPNFAPSGSSASSPSSAPQLIGNLTVTSTSNALKFLPSISPLSSTSTYPIISLTSPDVLIAANVSVKTIFTRYITPSADNLFISSSSALFTALPSLTLSRSQSHLSASADPLVASTQIMVPAYTALLMNRVELYRTFFAAQNVTISKLSLNATFEFQFASFDTWGALEMRSDKTSVSTFDCRNQTCASH